MAVMAIPKGGTLFGGGNPPSFTAGSTTDGRGNTVVTQTASNGRVATFTVGSKTVTISGLQSRTFIETKRVNTDDFARTRTASWGSTPNGGGAWSVFGGTAADADFSCDGSVGIINLATVNVSRYANQIDTVAAYDVRMKFSLDKAPAGNTVSVSLMTGYQDSDNHYRHRLSVTSTGSVTAAIASVVATTSTDIAASTTVGSGYVANDAWWIRATFDGVNTRSMYTWKDGTTEPTTPTRTATDTTFMTGRVGIRTLAGTGTTNVPVAVKVSPYTVSASWPYSPTITHSTWVRLLPTPFSTFDATTQAWLTARLLDTTPDILATAVGFITGAPYVPHSDYSSRNVLGQAGYGPLTTAGLHSEGADFNDFIRWTWPYPNLATPTSDINELAEITCLDCSGLVRMTFGFWGGLPMSQTDSADLNGLNLPRTSKLQGVSGPGVIVASGVGTAPAVTDLRIGDLVFFDATNGSDEDDGDLDHVGIYMGADTNGAKRFISSRKTPNGPTFADLASPSIIGASNFYSLKLRIIRRA